MECVHHITQTAPHRHYLYGERDPESKRKTAMQYYCCAHSRRTNASGSSKDPRTVVRPANQIMPHTAYFEWSKYVYEGRALSVWYV